MKNEKLFVFLILFFFFSIFFTTTISAQSNYVLPYPSAMPGGLSYKIHLIYEQISKYWYFGDFGQFHYNLKMADKYLVEAKTLFEYKQYLLGFRAIEESNVFFSRILPNLTKAKKNNKDVVDKKNILNSAAQKHIEILEQIEISTPDTFNWQPEKTFSTMLNIKELIVESISIRKNVL